MKRYHFTKNGVIKFIETEYKPGTHNGFAGCLVGQLLKAKGHPHYGYCAWSDKVPEHNLVVGIYSKEHVHPLTRLSRMCEMNVSKEDIIKQIKRNFPDRWSISF